MLETALSHLTDKLDTSEIIDIFTTEDMENTSLESRIIYAAINVMPDGGGPRDEVGTLNVLEHPRWGILANFEHKCWPRDREV